MSRSSTAFTEAQAAVPALGDLETAGGITPDVMATSDHWAPGIVIR